MSKLSFKKQAPMTGRAAVGHPYPDTDIKSDGKVVGHIAAPNWQTKGNEWSVWFQILKDERNDDGNDNCPWMNVRMKLRHDSEQDAREWIKNRWVQINERYTLYSTEDD